MKAFKHSLNKPTEQLVKEEVEKEFLRRYADIEQSVSHTVAVQLLSVVLVTLDKNYGWRKDRLLKFKQSVDSYFKMMQRGFFGNEIDCLDTVKYIKDKYGVDLENEVKVEIKND